MTLEQQLIAIPAYDSSMTYMQITKTNLVHNPHMSKVITSVDPSKQGWVQRGNEAVRVQVLQLHSRSPLQLGQGHIRSDEKNLTCTTVPSEENCKVDLIIVFPNSGGEVFLALTASRKIRLVVGLAMGKRELRGPGRDGRRAWEAYRAWGASAFLSRVPRRASAQLAFLWCF
jgi:hypothetical protein